MKKMVKWTGLVLALVLMVSLFAACGDTNVWTVQVGDVQVESGVYLGYLVSNYNEAKNRLEVSNIDSVEGFWEKEIDKKPVEEWVLEQTLDQCYTHVISGKLFQEMGLSFTEDEMEGFQTTVDNSWLSMEHLMLQNGCSKTSFRKILLATFQRSKIFQTLYGEKGEKEVAESELKKFYQENYASIRLFSAPLYNETNYQSLTESEITELENKFKGMAGRIANGAEFLEIVKEYQEKNAEETSSEPASETKSETASEPKSEPASETKSEPASETASEDASEGDTYLQVIEKVSDTYSEKLTEATFKLKVGETTYVKDTYTIYLLKREALTDKDFTERKTSVLELMKQDEFDADLLAQAKKMELIRNEAAISRFSVKNIEGRFMSQESLA